MLKTKSPTEVNSKGKGGREGGGRKGWLVGSLPHWEVSKSTRKNFQLGSRRPEF